MPEAVAGTFTQTSPPGTVFSTLYLRAQNYVMGPSDADVATIAKEGINEGFLRLNTRKWTWARISEDLTLVTGTQEYAIGGTFKAVRSCETLNAAGEVNGQLGFVDPKNFEDVFPNRSVSGSPSAYTIFNEFDNGKLTLSCPASAGYVAVYKKLRLRYWRRTNTLTGDSSLSTCPSECEPFLVWTARAVVAAHWDNSKYLIAKQRADEYWAMLCKDDIMHEIGDW